MDNDENGYKCFLCSHPGKFEETVLHSGLAIAVCGECRVTKRWSSQANKMANAHAHLRMALGRIDELNKQWALQKRASQAMRKKSA